MWQRRFKHTQSLQDRLAAFAQGVRDKACQLPPGEEKDELLRKAQQADTASYLQDGVNSSPLSQGPK